jgi:hypothetical protein
MKTFLKSFSLKQLKIHLNVSRMVLKKINNFCAIPKYKSLHIFPCWSVIQEKLQLQEKNILMDLMDKCQKMNSRKPTNLTDKHTVQK